MIWALLYLVAIVAANVSVALFGPASTPVNAFLMIGATLTLRDKLHDSYGPYVTVVLIIIGTALCLPFGDVARIALAGAAAFALSETTDTVIYHILKLEGIEWLVRANVSNACAAAVDSVVFPILAFGGFPVLIIVGQFVAKTAGGALWAFLLNKRRRVVCHS